MFRVWGVPYRRVTDLLLVYSDPVNKPASLADVDFIAFAACGTIY